MKEHKSITDATGVLRAKAELEGADHRRNILILTVGSIAVVVLVTVAVSSLLKGDVRVAAIDALAAVFLIILLLFFKYSRYQKECCYIGVAMMFSLYAYLFFSGAANGNTYMWHYTFPFFATFLLGANHGAIATILLFIPVFLYVILDAFTPGEGYYSSSFAIRFIPSVTVALLFSYLFERERQRFKEKTVAAYREQEKIIEKRTRQLEKEIGDREHIAQQLRQSQKMEALGLLAGGVAHDLNNILAGIVSYPELIRLQLPEDSPLHTPIKTIEKSGKRAAAVVDDMLTLARNVASVKETVNLNTLIDDFLDSPEWSKIQEIFPGVSIVTHLYPSSLLISCSQVHIRKCLMNLLYNAAEASAPDGKVAIRTGPVHESEMILPHEFSAAQYVHISVEDSGAGIDDEHIEHIFEPFYSTKKMGHSGSGLGLSVVWSTVEDHEGKVLAENTSSGALFRIILPAMAAGSSEPLPQALVTLESLSGKGSILVVDDEPELLEIARMILEKLGYTVSLASSGEEALLLHQQQNFDMIILDMILGDGLNGRQTYERMLGRKTNQKAIVVSGYSASQDVDKALKLGAHSIIKKPYNLEELGTAVKECLAEEFDNGERP